MYFMKRLAALACLLVACLQAHAQTPDPLSKLLKQLGSKKGGHAHRGADGAWRTWAQGGAGDPRPH